jgi:hypothetical protein
MKVSAISEGEFGIQSLTNAFVLIRFLLALFPYASILFETPLQISPCTFGAEQSDALSLFCGVNGIFVRFARTPLRKVTYDI